MRRIDLAAGLACLLLVAGTPALAGKEPPVGAPVPDALGETADHRPVLASDYRGKVLVISFWASWCEPCRKELPVLEQLQRAATGSGLQVVAVNIEDGRTFRKVMKKLPGLMLTFTRKSAARSSRDFGVGPIPHMVIVGRDGRIERRFVGYDERGLPEIVDLLNGLLTASPAEAPAPVPAPVPPAPGA